METPWKLLPICGSGHVLQAQGKHFCGGPSVGGRHLLSCTVPTKEQPPASSRNLTGLKALTSLRGHWTFSFPLQIQMFNVHRCAAAPVGCIFLFDLLEKLEQGKCKQAAPCLLCATTTLLELS